MRGFRLANIPAHPKAKTYSAALKVVTIVLLAFYLAGCAGKIREAQVQTTPQQTQRELQYIGEIRGQFGTRSLLNPVDLAFDASRDVYVLDKGNSRLVKLAPDYSFLEENGGYGLGINGLNSPQAITTDGGIQFFILDQGNDRIVRSDYNLVFADELRFDSNPDLVSLGKIADIGYSRYGNMYLVDPDNLRTVVLDKDYAIAYDLFPAGGFTNCTSIFITDDTKVYVYDAGDNTIYQFDSSGNSVGQIDLQGTGELGGFAIRNDRIYATDRVRNELVVFDMKGNLQLSYDVVAGSQMPRFSHPTGIAVSSDLKLFVCDSGNNRIVIYDLAAPMP